MQHYNNLYPGNFSGKNVLTLEENASQAAKVTIIPNTAQIAPGSSEPGAVNFVSSFLAGICWPNRPWYDSYRVPFKDVSAICNRTAHR